MKDRVFLDTNVLLYSYSSEEDKNQIAKKLLNNYKDIYISKQVVNETINIFIKKFKIDFNTIIEVVNELENELIILDFDTKTQILALRLKKKYNLQYYDSLIVATALENSCNIIFSEDMQNNLLIEKKLKIINPFKNK